MIEIKGKYNEAKIFTDVVDSASIAQVQELCNQEFTTGSRIRLMPDIHAGAGCTIGTTIVCVGKGNEDWNCSAPHGAGRLMSRADAKQSFTVSEFKKQMVEVYTTSVSKATLDECPMAYKGIQDILNNIGPTAEVVKIIRPIYNFKAGDED